MIRKISLLAFMLGSLATFAQDKYFTKQGKAYFYSDSPAEKIEATNKRVTSVLEVTTGKIEFAILISAFEFEKALMQEHFNENYMESTKYPKATFKGTITNWNEVDIKKDGKYPVTVSGDLTMHGETNKITEKGTIIVKDGKISAESSFKVELKDYKIKIPSVVGKNVAESVQIKITINNYEPLKK